MSFQKWRIICREMCLLIQKRFLQSSATLSQIPQLTNSNPPFPSTVQFLVNSCEIPFQSALSLSKHFHLDDKTRRNAQSVLQFLKSHHFSDTLLASLIVKCPRVLRCRIKSNLQSKFEYLIQNGFEGELLPQIILSNPAIAYKSSILHIKYSFEFLWSVFDRNEKVLLAIKRSSWLLSSNLKVSFQPNVEFLLKEGVPANRVEKLLVLHPRSLFLKPDRIVHVVSSIRDLGFEPGDSMFIYAFRTMAQLSESTWRKKIEIMKNLGFDETEILEGFKRCPSFLSGSEEKLRSMMDFYVNVMRLESSSVIANPILFRISIEKTLRPRYNVLTILKAKNLIKDIKRTHLFTLGEKSFRKRFVERFIEEVPGLLQAYVGIKEVQKIGA